MKIIYKPNPLATIVELDEQEQEAFREKLSKLDEDSTIRYDYGINALKGKHDGDCVCEPMTCLKRYIEELLGIDTLAPFPGKHELNYVRYAFDDKDTTIDEALEKLRTYKPNATWEGWEVYAERWIGETKRAYEYLLNYKKEKLDDAQNLNR